MTDDLKLDDQGMNLLNQIAEAFDNWLSIAEHGERNVPEEIEILSANGPVGSIMLGATDTRQRRHDTSRLTREFIEHVYLLDKNRDVPIVRQLDWHISLDASILFLVRRAHDDPHLRHGAEHVLQKLIPLYQQMKARQDKKEAWLRRKP